jgi:hypothetical protein
VLFNPKPPLPLSLACRLHGHRLDVENVKQGNVTEFEAKQGGTKQRPDGADVRRQGDIFAIETSLLTRELPGPTEHHAQLFGTSHVATDARRVNGTVYIRGTLRHEPRSRRAQHQMLRLGRSWWIAVKNLAVASWNAVGNVD